MPEAGTVSSLGAPPLSLSGQFGNIFLGDPALGTQTPPKKERVKTRGDPSDNTSDPQKLSEPRDKLDDQAETYHDARPTFLLPRRALRVFNCIFYHPSQHNQPGEIMWRDFLYAMVALGFSPNKLYGSVWTFEPVGKDLNALSERRINVHKPHPVGKMPFEDARRLGRRLTRAYGLDSSSFAEK